MVILIGAIVTRLLTDVAQPVAGALAVQWQSTLARPPLKVAVKVEANHKVAGSLVLLFKGVVEPQVSVGVSSRAVIDAKLI